MANLNSLDPVDLDNGNRLIFQKNASGMVRAVVKDASGAILVTGSVVQSHRVVDTRMEVLEKYSNLKLKVEDEDEEEIDLSSLMEPYEDDDEEEEDEEDDYDEEEDEED